MSVRGIALWLGVSCCLWSSRAAAQDRPPPMNFLVIVLDDVGTDQLGFYNETPTSCLPVDCATLCSCAHPCPMVVGACYDNMYARTPRLDALAASGVRFTRFYTNPLCSPTRSALMTGRHPFRTGIGTVLEPDNMGCVELENSHMFISELLRRGFPGVSPTDPLYACGAFGKWHMAKIGNGTTTTSNSIHPIRNGFDRFYGSIQNTRLHYTWEKIESDRSTGTSVFMVDGSTTTPAYQTTFWDADVNRRDAVDWINAQSKSYFAYVCFNPPHTNLRVPPSSLLSADTLCELSCSISGTSLNPGDYAPNTEYGRRLVYRAMLEAVDTEIGLLLDGIDKEKLANTMVFVLGDNGTHIPEIVSAVHDSSHGKSTIYDHGTRTPLIVSGPLVPTPPSGGHVSSVPVGAVDLWRTIEDISGADETVAGAPSSTIDSQSFVAYIVNPSATPTSPRYAFSEIFNPNFLASTGPLSMTRHDRSITDGTYKYIRKQTSSTFACYLPPGVTSCTPWPCASPGCITLACPNAGCDASCTPLTGATPTYVEELYDISSDQEEAASTNLGTSHAEYARMSAAMDAVSGP